MPNTTSTSDASSLRVTLVDSRAIPSALAIDWNRMAAGSPLKSWEWYDVWWQNYRRPNYDLYILVVHDDQQNVLGIAPWYRTRSLINGKTLRFLADNEVCTDYQTILCSPLYRNNVIHAITEWLLGKGQNDWDSLDWIGSETSDPTLNSLAEMLNDHGATVHHQAMESTWRLALPKTWEELLKTRISKSRREKLRTIEKKYIRTGRAEVELLTDPRDLDNHFERLIELHQARRHELGDLGRFADPTFRKFHYQVLADALTSGNAYLQTLWIDGVASMVEYSFRSTETTMFYQGGMNPATSGHGPGWLNFTFSIQRAIERGQSYFDFLRGDEPYKSSWGAEPIPLMRTRIISDKTIPRLRNTVWLAGKSVRQWARETLSAARGKSEEAKTK